MTIAEMHALGQKADQAVAKHVKAALARRGVPATPEQVRELAEELHPHLRNVRRQVYHEAVDEMGRTADAIGYEVSPAHERLYPVDAVVSIIEQAVGLGDTENTLPVEILDPVTQRMSTVRLSPWQVENPSREVTEIVSERISAQACRHVRAVARQMVADTVRYGFARHKESKRPAAMGYARVLSGAENCPFCAMLASRGAVYKKDTVTRRRDGNRYHDHCDCIARLVIEGEPWEGEAEFRRLEKLWAASTGDVDGKEKLEVFAAYIDSGIPDVNLRLPQSHRKIMRSAPYYGNEPLPSIGPVVKHSIWGWKPGYGEITKETVRNGHSYDSVRPSGTFFPKHWTDQNIADAITNAIEEPVYLRSKADRRYAVGFTDGVYIEVQWKIVKGKAKGYSAYPLFGDGVEGYSRGERIALDNIGGERLNGYSKH